MELTRADAQRAAVSVRGWIRSPNINGISVRTTRDGEHIIEVHVRKKKQLHEMGARDILIPRFVQHPVKGATGRDILAPFRTDVVQRGEMRHKVLADYQRPAPGGYGISVTRYANAPFRPSSGTLGVNMRWRGVYRMLTNQHVVCYCDDDPDGYLGRKVYQPTPDYQWLTTVTGAIPVGVTTNWDAQIWNRYDFAWCDIDMLRGFPEIHGIGTPTGYRAPVRDERVRWIGAQTGAVREATITDTEAIKLTQWGDDYADWGRGVACWENAMVFDTGTLAPGDSGCAVVAVSDAYVVGLMSASNQDDEYPFALRIPDF